MGRQTGKCRLTFELMFQCFMSIVSICPQQRSVDGILVDFTQPFHFYIQMIEKYKSLSWICFSYSFRSNVLNNTVFPYTQHSAAPRTVQSIQYFVFTKYLCAEKLKI